MSAKKGLGRGIGALIPEAPPQTGGSTELVQHIAVHRIEPNPHQPRRVFARQELEELAASIAERGVLQPLLVRPGGGGYQLIAGERRLRAAQLAGRETVPAIVRTADDRDLQELALIENIQREDLNVVEEAEAYQSLIDRYSFTQESLAREVGKSRAAITNALRLLRLPPAIKEDLLAGAVMMGHARAYLSLESPQQQEQAHRRVVKQGMSVRQTENFVRKIKDNKKISKKNNKNETDHPGDDFVTDQLRRVLSTRVQIQRGKQGGRLLIEFYSDAELDRIYEILRGRGL